MCGTCMYVTDEWLCADIELRSETAAGNLQADVHTSQVNISVFTSAIHVCLSLSTCHLSLVFITLTPSISRRSLQLQRLCQLSPRQPRSIDALLNVLCFLQGLPSAPSTLLYHVSKMQKKGYKKVLKGFKFK